VLPLHHPRITTNLPTRGPYPGAHLVAFDALHSAGLRRRLVASLSVMGSLIKKRRKRMRKKKHKKLLKKTRWQRRQQGK
jgi:hypothetical protein